MSKLDIYRATGSSRFDPAQTVHVGEIDTATREFRYSDSYLARKRAMPLSLSLPLSKKVFPENENRPYFEGLLPEGEALRSIAAKLAKRTDDYLGILASCGLDCIGDVVIKRDAFGDTYGYKEVSIEELRLFANREESAAPSNAASKLSIAGTQEKVGLCNFNEHPDLTGWLRPLGGAASTHILKSQSIDDLSLIESIALACADACGIDVAETNILRFSDRNPIICSKRFDRVVTSQAEHVIVRRLHQEDLAQAFALAPSSKYAELEGGTAKSIAALLRERSANPLVDIMKFARLACFNYLIGNCDNHLKNISLLFHEDGEHVSLAPAYDIVSTTRFARFDREMGMRIGETREIDEVTSRDFEIFAQDMGIAPKALRIEVHKIVERAGEALRQAGKALERNIPYAPYVADDLEEDMALRQEVLRSFANGSGRLA